MSRRNKTQAQFDVVDDSRVVTNSFRLRSSSGAGRESYRTVDYRLYHKLEEGVMLPLLDEYLDRLFAGSVDDGNGDMLSGIIFGAAREAYPDLCRQRYDHGDMLRRLIIARKADRADIQMLLEEREAECAVMQADLDRVCAMMDKELEEA